MASWFEILVNYLFKVFAYHKVPTWKGFCIYKPCRAQKVHYLLAVSVAKWQPQCTWSGDGTASWPNAHMRVVYVVVLFSCFPVLLAAQFAKCFVGVGIARCSLLVARCPHKLLPVLSLSQQFVYWSASQLTPRPSLFSNEIRPFVNCCWCWGNIHDCTYWSGA